MYEYFVKSRHVGLVMINIVVSRDDFLETHKNSENYNLLLKYPNNTFLDYKIKSTIPYFIYAWFVEQNITDYELREYKSNMIAVAKQFQGIFFKNKEDALKFKLTWN